MGNLSEIIKVAAFDADDTLWENQPMFDAAEEQFCDVMVPFASRDRVKEALYATEMRNMEELGYGSMAFTLSLTETALALSDMKIGASQIAEIQRIGRSLLTVPHDPMPGVVDTLSELAATRAYRMVLFTKGDNREQGRKVAQSGLARFFSHVEIVSDKTQEAYANLIRLFGIRPEEFLMIGNSFKSDIAPVLGLGGWGIYIPYHNTWQHELTDEFEHPRLRKVLTFSDLPNII